MRVANLGAALTRVAAAAVDKHAAGVDTCSWGVGRKQCAVRKDIADRNKTASALIMVGSSADAAMNKVPPARVTLTLY